MVPSALRLRCMASKRIILEPRWQKSPARRKSYVGCPRSSVLRDSNLGTVVSCCSYIPRAHRDGTLCEGHPSQRQCWVSTLKIVEKEAQLLLESLLKGPATGKRSCGVCPALPCPVRPCCLLRETRARPV